MKKKATAIKKKRKPETPAVQKKRAAQRRKRYKTDAEYRRAAIEASRKTYREAHDVETMDCRKNLKNLQKFGVPRYVLLPNKQKKTMLTFTIPEVAKVFGGYNPQMMYRWIYTTRLPEPVCLLVFPDNGDNVPDGVRVFSEAEVRAAIPLLGEHQQHTRHYRSTHVEFKAKLHAAIKKARETL